MYEISTNFVIMFCKQIKSGGYVRRETKYERMRNKSTKKRNDSYTV